jgi:hypothetical protein
MDNSMCHNGYKSQAEDDGNPPLVYSPDLLPCDFWFFVYAKEQLKDQLITNQSNLEDKRTDIWESVSRESLQSVFFEWTERLEWVIEYAGDY